MLLLAATMVSIVASVLYSHTPALLQMLRNGDVEGIEDYIRSAGHRGRFFLVAIQVIETVAIFLPALPVYIAAGVVYGRLQGTLLCYITNVVTNMGMFYFLRRLKSKADELTGGKRNRRIENWLQSSPHPERVILVICFLPIIPNGMISVMASRSGITASQYFKALVIGCLPAILISVFFGDFLLNWLPNLLRQVLMIL